jgi:hypothetical protein
MDKDLDMSEVDAALERMEKERGVDADTNSNKKTQPLGFVGPVRQVNVLDGPIKTIKNGSKEVANFGSE